MRVVEAPAAALAAPLEADPPPVRSSDCAKSKYRKCCSIPLLTPALCFDAYAFRWLRWGDDLADKKNLREQMINTFTNIALVAALFLMIAMEFILESGDLREHGRRVYAIYIFIWMASFTFFSFCTINSSLLLLALNELPADENNTSTMHFNSLFEVRCDYPFYQFYLGGMTAGAGFALWLWLALPNRYAIGALISFGIVTVLINALWYHDMLDCLWIAIETRRKGIDPSPRKNKLPVVLSPDTIQHDWGKFLEQNGLGVTADSFVEYLKSHHAPVEQEERAGEQELAWFSERVARAVVEAHVQAVANQIVTACPPKTK